MGIEDLLAGRLNGVALRAVARALRHPAAAKVGAQIMGRELGLEELWQLIDGSETIELCVVPRLGRPPRPLQAAAPLPRTAPWAPTAEAFRRMYARGVSPEQVVERIVAEADRIKGRKPWLDCLWTRAGTSLKEEARASAQRYQAGAPLGPLDGVPVLVKEQIAVRGLPRRLGGVLPGAAPMREDAALVARLRRAGALIVGQTAMTELGLSPLGVNAQRPALRNPHDAERAAGGSSTGAAVAAALGLACISVGADGGGSVRIPAALSGVFGLKPSFGRVPRTGDAFSGSLNCAGPLASSTLDLAHFLDATAGEDPGDPTSASARGPEQSFAKAVEHSAAGLRIGVDEAELREAEPDIVKACEKALKALEAAGCVLVDVKLALARHAPALGALTIITELRASLHRAWRDYPEEFSPDVSVLLAMASAFDAERYLLVQALRERLRQETRRLFLDVDLLALPTTRVTAPHLSAADDMTGRVDGKGTRDLVRYTFLANLTGLPAGTAPVGLDREGLPIGLQLLGDAWDEASVLRGLAELERCGAARLPRSPHHIDLTG